MTGWRIVPPGVDASGRTPTPFQPVADELGGEQKPKDKRGLIGCAVMVVLVAVISIAVGIFRISAEPPTCEELVRQIVKLYEQNESPSAGKILKLTEVSELAATDRVVLCRGLARRSRGGAIWLIFHWEVDDDGDAFIGYRPG